MYQRYFELCNYCSVTPIANSVFDAFPMPARMQLISMLYDNLKLLERLNKPKEKEPPKRKVLLKEDYLSLPYVEEQMRVRNIRHFDLSSMPTDDMMDIKDSIQREFFKRQSNVRFKEEKLGLDLVVTQKAQMYLFDPRTTVKKSNLYNN